MKKRFMRRRKDGFTLIITIMLMTMLTLLSIGMLTLGAVTLRGGSVAEYKRTANANAQLALMMAIGELQKQLGDDRRITADASILKSGSTNSAQSHLVGVWESENPYADTSAVVSDISPPKYDKDRTFKKWLISSPNPSETEDKNYGTGSAPSGPTLFSEQMDGYEIRSEAVPVNFQDKPGGNYAWAVSQENTKAKINVGTDVDRSEYNMAVQAPTRPDLEIGGILKQPKKDWTNRSNRVISKPQAILDADYGIKKGGIASIGPDYTVTAQGVLADVAKGRLKTDLSLGFEMSANDYSKSKWDNIDNPFVIGKYGDTPLFTPPLGSGGPTSYPIAYGSINYQEVFFASAPPTFQTLRSYYRLYRHVYNSGGGPTVFQRPQQSNYWNTAYQGYPAQVPDSGNATELGPILDRVLMVFCVYGTPEGQAAVVISPIITLWNPYNVGLDCNGLVAYPFMDLPNFFTMNRSGPSGAGSYGSVMSQAAGFNLKNDGGGRQQEPYFYCQMTADGTPSMTSPIHFAAGEVKVFQPSSGTPVVFKRADILADPKKRVVPMMPVTAATPATSVRGGIAYPMNQTMAGGAGLPVTDRDSLSLTIGFTLDTSSNYRYGIALEDSFRITDGYRTNLEKRAKFWNEIHVLPSVSAGPFTSPSYPVSATRTTPQVVAVIETYHRTELNAAGTVTTADLLLSTNPRQRYMHPNLVPTTNFKNGTGPHYENHMRRIASFADLGLQTGGGGTTAYYGASNNAQTGRDHISLFDVPREPQMSLGAFQHADLTDLVSAPAYQFGNSWASPYVEKNLVSHVYRRNNITGQSYSAPLCLYDTSYLANCALWDSYYFSSAGPIVTRRTISTPSANNYKGDPDQISESSSTQKELGKWIDDPEGYPLRNSRHLLHMGNMSKSDLKAALADPKGCRDISAHILVDGAFNVNSTSEVAWASVLASLKGDNFSIEGANSSGTYKSGSNTPFPRLRYPAGPVFGGGTDAGAKWDSFRELSDSEIKTLAEQLVKEVKSRGPFQSLGEFVNRRLTSTDQGSAGAVQTAIDNSGLNNKVAGVSYDVSPWGSLGANFKKPTDVATATSAWLTQADVLTALAPIITVRSDTFTVRAYGEALDDKSNVTARSWCEATVQRVPEFVDSSDDSGIDLTQRNKINTTFGRRFEILSFRWISPEEITGQVAS